MDFERCDGKVFSYDEVNTASINYTQENVSITGGQSSSPLAIIDTTKGIEVTFESSQFSMDMFAMANAENIKDSDENYDVLETKRFDVKDNGGKLQIEIPYKITDKSVKIRGLELMDGSTTPTTGKFTLKVEDAKATIELASDDVTAGDSIRVSYRRVVNQGSHTLSVSTTSTTAKGAVTWHLPVYSSGTDCTESSIKGMLHIVIYRCRVTALPGFSTSYKSASTNSATFTAIDPKRADGKFWDMTFEPMG